MRIASITSIALSLGLCLLVGCGSDTEADKMVRQQLAKGKELAEIYEAAKGDPNAVDSNKEMKIFDEGAALEKKLDALPKGQKEAAEKKFKSEIDALKVRIEKARKTKTK